MMSKVLLLVIFGCSAIIAAPVGDLSTKSHGEYEDFSEEEHTEDETLQMQTHFTGLVESLGGAIKRALDTEFTRIDDQFETPETSQAVKDLQEIYKVVYDEDHNIEGTSQEKKEVETGLRKIAEAFENMLDKAIENIQNAKDEKINSDELVEQIKKMKEAIKKIHRLF